MIDLSQLATFHAVATHGNVTRAAETLLISQPAVSKQLAALERTLATKLFERTRRGVRLTESGELLAQYARRMAALTDEADAALDDLQHLRRGRLAIGATPDVAAYLLPEALVRFRQRFPGVELRLETGDSSRMAAALRDRQIDFALTDGLLPGPEFSSSVCATDELVAIAPPFSGPDCGAMSRERSAPQALTPNVGAVDVADLARESLVVLEGDAGRVLLRQVFGRRAGSLRIVLAVATTEAVKRAVSAGLDVAVVPRMSVASELASGTLAARKLRSDSARRPVYLVRLRTRGETKPVTAFLCLLKHVVRGTLPKLGPRPGPRGAAPRERKT
jgi:DNA-binding transcriptional LysR family regulator